MTYLVAITQLVTPVEAEATALAAELGGVAYDHRLKLAAGLPAIVLSTPDPEVARPCVAAIRARGHEAIVVSTTKIVPASAMTAPRTFELEPDALVAGGERLAWTAIAVIVRATHRITTASTTATTEKKLAPVRAVITGGLIMSKTTTSTRTSHVSDNEQVVYLYGGQAPWIVREQHVRYDALGSAVTAHSLKNFELTIAELRKRAPHSVFDDRLVTRKGTPEDIDVLAHIVATTAR